MTDGRLFLAIAAVICIGVFLNGLRFYRMNRNPWSGKSIMGIPVEGGDLSRARVRRLGLGQMIAAPLMLILFIALCFGLLGPVQGIQTIKL
ncbi:hypothetical protein ACLB0R_10955 [Sphingomonas sp. GlSt437]|uniref:hypothetical protein n=1 Tax=Sphingomonas sp. GlSt437 TaxID=3389970 RepID=UPI003A885E2E